MNEDMKKKKKLKHWAVYRGDNFVYMGDTEECANYLGVTVDSFGFYRSPVYQRRKKDKSAGLFIVDVSGVIE